MPVTILYHLYSGQLIFSAAALFLIVAAADLLGLLNHRPVLRRIAGFAAVLTIPVGALSGTPLPLALAIFVLVATLAYALFGFGAPGSRRHLLGGISIVAVLVVCAVELPYHLRRHSAIRCTRLFVLGDSLASGGFGERITWPKLLELRLRLLVTNLAAPSETAITAVDNQLPLLRQRQVSSDDCVIIELGGNDMLEGVPAPQFAAALDRILTTARGTVIVLELPLLPGRWQYGMIQRQAVRKHHALLAPKRILARVLLAPGNTSDGIHLLQQGHEALAGKIARWITSP
jgi:lysophospholipase L1-like esterase